MGQLALRGASLNIQKKTFGQCLFRSALPEGDSALPEGGERFLAWTSLGILPRAPRGGSTPVPNRNFDLDPFLFRTSRRPKKLLTWTLFIVFSQMLAFLRLWGPDFGLLERNFHCWRLLGQLLTFPVPLEPNFMLFCLLDPNFCFFSFF